MRTIFWIDPIHESDYLSGFFERERERELQQTSNELKKKKKGGSGWRDKREGDNYGIFGGFRKKINKWLRI